VYVKVDGSERIWELDLTTVLPQLSRQLGNKEKFKCPDKVKTSGYVNNCYDSAIRSSTVK